MRLSASGRCLMGVGGVGVRVSIDGVVPAALAGVSIGGTWDWIDSPSATIGGQGDITGGTGPYQLLRYVFTTNVRSVLDTTPTGTNDASQNFRANANQWAAFMSGGALRGVRSATVPFAGSSVVGTCHLLPPAGLCDIDEAGRVYTLQTFATDSGIAAYDPSGTRLWTNPTKVLDGSNRLRARAGAVTYQDTAGAWHLLNAATGVAVPFAPRTDEVIAAVVPVLVNGAIWVVELSVTRITLRVATSSQGYVLTTSPDLFNPDVVALSGTQVRVGWSVTTGERNTDLRTADVTVDTGGFTSGSSSGGALAFTPQAPLSLSSFSTGPVQFGVSPAVTPTQKTVEKAKLAGAQAPRRQYPHVPEVADPAAQRTLRLLWDRVFDMDEQLNGTKPSALQTSMATVSADLASFQSSQQLALQQLSAATTGTPLVVHSFPGGGGSGSGGGGGGGSGGGGGGGQSSDCAGAPATGHIPAGDLTFDRALQIICGTSVEWGGLTSSTLDLATREANAEELIRRMIWHLALGGFTAGRQRNPSTAISKDKLAVVILGETRAFDVFRSFDSFNKTMVVQMNEVFPADLVADSGISD